MRFAVVNDFLPFIRLLHGSAVHRHLIDDHSAGRSGQFFSKPNALKSRSNQSKLYFNTVKSTV
jgi:hypothetical protein